MCRPSLTSKPQPVYHSGVMKTHSVLPIQMQFASLLLTAAISLSAAAQTQPSNPQLAAPELNARVESLLKQMTLDEKIGQLVQYSAGYATGPGASNLKYDDLAAKGQAGSFLNVVGAEATNHYQHLAVEKSRLHIPLLFGQDVIHGHRTTFPVPLAVGGQLRSGRG